MHSLPWQKFALCERFLVGTCASSILKQTWVHRMSITNLQCTAYQNMFSHDCVVLVLSCISQSTNYFTNANSQYSLLVAFTAAWPQKTDGCTTKCHQL